jgi:hypothetical protein
LRFTVRRPARAEVSPCCHRPSGGDIACGVYVGIERPCTTGDANENRLALATFRCDVPASGASLRRIGCRNNFETRCGLVFEPSNQHSPSLAADLTIEAPFLGDVGTWALASTARRAGHGAHIQILDSNGVVAARQIGAELFYPVTAAICFARSQPCNGQLRSRPPMRIAMRPGQTLLQSAQPLGFTSRKAGHPQQLPARKCNRNRHTSINANHAAITRSCYRVGHRGKSYVPAPRSIQRDSVRLHGVRDVAGPPKPCPSHFRYPYLPEAMAHTLNVARLESNLPESFVPTGLTPRRTTMRPVEKVAHRLREVAQRLLLHGLRPGGQPAEFSAGSSQLSTLLVVTGRLPTQLPVPLLLDGKIPHKTCVATVFGQRRRLLTGREHSKPTHAENICPSTDKLSKGGGGVSPGYSREYSCRKSDDSR